MKIDKMKEMTMEELDQQLEDIRKEQFNLQLQQVSGQLENPARVKELRRTVARIKTLLNQRAEG